MSAENEDNGHIVSQLFGRARFLRDRGEVKSPGIMEEAAKYIMQLEAKIPPWDRPSMISDFDAFLAWATDHLGRGYSLEHDEGTFDDPVTRWAFKGYAAGLACRTDFVSTAPAGTPHASWDQWAMEQAASFVANGTYPDQPGRHVNALHCLLIEAMRFANPTCSKAHPASAGRAS